MVINTMRSITQQTLIPCNNSWGTSSLLTFPLVTILTGFTAATTAAGYDVWAR
jgi:hypothetical protein